MFKAQLNNMYTLINFNCSLHGGLLNVVFKSESWRIVLKWTTFAIVLFANTYVYTHASHPYL